MLSPSDTFACSQTIQVFPPAPGALYDPPTLLPLPDVLGNLVLGVGGFPSLPQACDRPTLNR